MERPLRLLLTLWYCPKSTLCVLRQSNYEKNFHCVSRCGQAQGIPSKTSRGGVEVPPVAQRQRRILYAYVQAVDKKLEELLSTDVIEETEGPTPWVSPVVIAPKMNGYIRLCVDLRRANEAIIRERHPLPTMDESLHEASGRTVVSKINLPWGFHQVELEKLSWHLDLTTFVANGKLYSYKRLPFGISSAPQLYQKIICDVIRSTGQHGGVVSMFLSNDLPRNVERTLSTLS